jgi:hypothetical protein
MAAKKKSSTTNSVKAQKDQSTDGLDSAFAKQNAQAKETDKLLEAANKKKSAQLVIQDKLNESLKEAVNLEEAQKQAVGKLSKMWGDFQSKAAEYHQDVKDGLMTQEQANKKLNAMRVNFDRMAKAAGINTKENKDLVNVLKLMSKEMSSVQMAYDKTAKKAQLINTAIDKLGSSGIPLMSELSDVIKSSGEGLTALKVAAAAAGAAVALLAKNYFRPDIKAASDVENELRQMRTDNIAEIAKLDNKQAFVKKNIINEINNNSLETTNEVNRLTIEAAHSSQRAAIQFSAQLKTGAAEFNASAKTALYGKGIGSIGYGAAQMQLAGIGAENVAASLKEATKALGTKVTSEVAADMAVLEKRTGASAEGIASMVSFYKRLDKASDDTALNMAEGMRAMADSAGIDLGGYMEEVASASKEALGYQIKSGPALQKQVAYAQQLGVSFGDIAKAGKSMVLNYKDSIKKEMELSAMLGKNVNLSEARALFSQGKTDEALKSIKAQGLDPKAMNMFQQEALSQALGGLDLDSLQKIATGSAKDVSAQKGNVKAGNKGFLSTTQSAQSTLASQTASIQAQTAIIDAKLSGDITKAYLGSKGYEEYQRGLIEQQKAQLKLQQAEEIRFKKSKDYLVQLMETAKNEIKSKFSDNNLTDAAVGMGGAVIGSAVAGYLGKKFGLGGVQDVRIVKGGPMDVVEDVVSDKLSKKTNTKATEKATAKATEKATAKATEKASAKATTKATQKAAAKTTEKAAAKLTQKASTKAVEKIALKTTEKVVAKTAAKTLGKSLIKKIPFIGLGAGLFFAAQRAMAGDYAGAALEASSGAASMIPGGGTAASIAIDAALAARDLNQAGVFNSKSPQATVQNGKVVAKPSAAAATAKPSQVLSDVQYQTRLQMKMVELLGTSATLLQYILLENDSKQFNAGDINTMRLSNQLMVNAKKQMAVGRKEVVGANTASMK